MLTLDTDVIINYSIEEDSSEECALEYLSKENSDESFLTPKVYEQVFDYASKLTHQLVLIQKRMEQKDLSFREAQSDFLEDFEGEMDDAYASIFGNVMAYIEEKLDEGGTNIPDIEEQLTRRLARFHDHRRRIRPPIDMIKRDKEDAIQVEEKIEEDNLIHPGDLDVAMQAWRLHILESVVIDLVTLNVDDFRDDHDEWGEVLEFLSVFDPEDYLQHIS